MVITPHLTAVFRSTTSTNTFTNVPVPTAGTQNATSPAVMLYGVNAVNGDTGIIYLKFYNKVGATTADTPQRTLAVAAGVGSQTFLQGSDIADYYPAGCSFRVCTGFADSDNTSAGTAPIVELRYVPA